MFQKQVVESSNLSRGTIGKSKKFELNTTDTKGKNYDFFEITNVVIMFEDGTSITFDEYDCQFLSD